MTLTLPAVSRVAVAGDWHGDSSWANGVVSSACARLRRLGEATPTIVQLGDFGFWPRADSRFLDTLERNLARNKGVLLWVDGNHEDHDALRELTDAHGRSGPIAIRDHVWHAPRGMRWHWGGRTWLALGGAHSIDRARRVPGWTWFPGEELSAREALTVMSEGSADVIVAHDCPGSVPLRLLPDSRLPSDWVAERPQCDAHRERLQVVADVVRPTWWLHGHYHLEHQTAVTTDYGDMFVTGLDCNGSSGWTWGVLNVESMHWDRDPP